MAMAGKGSKSALTYAGEKFGQKRPPLSVTIKQILDRYPDGQIFKVLYSYVHHRDGMIVPGSGQLQNWNWTTGGNKKGEGKNPDHSTDGFIWGWGGL